MDRIEDDELRKKYVHLGCCLCNVQPSEGHHIKSKGAWGPDVEENLLALCRTHHVEIHAYGINKMILHYPKLNGILLTKGWYRHIIGTGRNEVVKWWNDTVTALLRAKPNQ